MSITDRWIKVYNELLSRGLVTNARDFCEKTGLSTSSVTEILKGRTGVGNKVLSHTIKAFPIIHEEGLREGKGPLLKAASPEKSLAKQILELKALMDKGIISEREFEQGKKKILR